MGKHARAEHDTYALSDEDFPSRKHIRRTGALARLSPAVRALLCRCEDCLKTVEQAFAERAERNARNKHLHPACGFCGSLTIWREIAFVCPYSESRELHAEVRDLNRAQEAPWMSSSYLSGTRVWN